MLPDGAVGVQTGPRILLVDDEPRNLTLLEGLLAPTGCELLRATDGESALALYVDRSPDLVLLDIAMPGLDGIDVLTHIRARGDASYVPVILVTAHNDRRYRLRGVEAGADEFLEKPIDRAILLARVRTLLRLRQTNEALAMRNAALERLQREQRELTAFIVHDLKGPLAVAQMNLAFAQDHPTLHDAPLHDTNVADALDDAATALRRLSSMVSDLLTIARLEQSDLPIRREAIELGPLLREVATSHAREALDKHIALSVQADETISLQGDVSLLRRVFENIVENAIRFTPESGRIAVDARRHDGIEVAFANTGASIPPDLKARLFDKFVRGDLVPSSRGSIGLGLYFCKRAVAAHGGEIEVAETQEWPTSFVVRLPA